MTLNRREDDPRPDVTPEAADELFASMPQVIAELREGRRANRDAAKHGRRVAGQARAIAVFVIICGLVGGAVWQQQNGDIKDNQRRIEEQAQRDRASTYELCVLINGNAAALNGLIDTITMRLRTNTDLTPAQRRAALSLYDASRQAEPLCKKPAP